MPDTKKRVAIILFLLFFVFMGLSIFLWFSSRSETIIPLNQQTQLKPSGNNYKPFKVNDIFQIKGLVLEKRTDNENKILVLRQGSNQEIEVTIKSGARMAKPIWNEEEKMVVSEGDYWDEIEKGTEITGVCLDESCKVLTSLYINKGKEL